MNRATLVALFTATLITSAAAIGLGATGKPPAAAMTRSQYLLALARIDSSRAWALAACAARRAAERETCEGVAHADAGLRAAELEARYRRTPEAAREAQRARIDVRYQAARARCASLRGYDHDQCLIDAHAMRGLALLESKAPYAMRAMAAQ
ncbi:MAG TPA: hypothetical protein VLS49_13400 [Usitatibacter sp.]|nr:hypothetical protein [Usitatibacter sp.]